MEEAIQQMQNAKLVSTFNVDQSLDISEHIYITKVQIDYLKLLCIFDTEPIKCNGMKHGWKFSDNTGLYTFCIYAKSHKDTRFYISANTKESLVIDDFMNTLCEALRVYEMDYKPKLQGCNTLQEIRNVITKIT
jgi:hypothetical protein